MNTEEFKASVSEQMKRMLNHWREVERWIKRAEQVNKQAVIPAINELRYAARQLLYADQLLRKTTLSIGERSVIQKRITIAEQYLMNADNDVVDSIVSFYSEAFYIADMSVGKSKVTEYFHDYPRLRQLVKDAEKEIGDTRHDPEDRFAVYRKLRKSVLQPLIDGYDSFLDAETLAALQLQKIELQSGRRSALNWGLSIVSVVSLGVALVSFNRETAAANVGSIVSYFSTVEEVVSQQD